MNFLTADPHLGHKAILNYRTQFSSIEEHDTYILDKFAKLNKKDIVKVLGDFIFDCDKYDYYIEQFKKMSCRIQIVMGNHDSLKLYKEDRFEIQLPLYSYKNIWLSHCPIHISQLKGRLGNIHGHIHGDTVKIYDILEVPFIPDKRYFNVNLDINKMNFVDFEEIKEHFNSKDLI